MNDGNLQTNLQVLSTWSESKSSSNSSDSDEFENIDIQNVKSGDVDISVDYKHDDIVVSKRASAIERYTRLQIHGIHIQLLLFHGWIRNISLQNDKIILALNDYLPKRELKKSKSIFERLKCLVNVFSQKFQVDASGLRKLGYFSSPKEIPDVLQINTPTDAFIKCAEEMKGSRDVGAQLFTGFCRSAGLKARMVFSLQPLGFTFNRSEVFNDALFKQNSSVSPYFSKKTQRSLLNDYLENKFLVSDGTGVIDGDLTTPIFWTEVWDDENSVWLAVDAIVSKSIYDSSSYLKLEPKTGNQVICYVIAYDSDSFARDVTSKYLSKWPGKSANYRTDKLDSLWTLLMLMYGKRVHNDLDLIEMGQLCAKKRKEEGPEVPNTIAGFKSSPSYVLERHLLREEIIKLGSVPFGDFKIGKGNNSRTEKIYLRDDIEVGKTSIVWRKEGRQIKEGEQPIKRVKARLMTLNRKRDHEVNGDGTPALDLLYSRRQTEPYVPPDVVNGIVPKGPYGNIDIFKKSMIPKGGIHLKYPYIEKVAKLLGIDYAEAVVGFEFKKRRAYPKVRGIVVAKDYSAVLLEAYQQYVEMQFEKEQEGILKEISTANMKKRKRQQIKERIEREYGDNEDNSSVG